MSAYHPGLLIAVDKQARYFVFSLWRQRFLINPGIIRMKHFIRHIITTLFLLTLALPIEAFADIEWHVHAGQSSQTSALITKSTGEGEAFVFDEGDCQSIPSSSRDLVSALTGSSFLLNQSPTSGMVAIHIMLDMNGNKFSPIAGKSLFLNMKIEVHVNGSHNDAVSFARSPLLVTVPSASLSDLLSCAGISRDGLICAYNDGGMFSATGITSSNMTSRFEASLEKQGHIAGGNSKDLGIESSVKASSWHKIKLLFK